MTDLPTEPGSVIQLDSLLMRTRFGNWVSDGGFIVTDEELAADIARGPAYEPTVIFDAALPEGIPWASTQATVSGEFPCWDAVEVRRLREGVNRGRRLTVQRAVSGVA